MDNKHSIRSFDLSVCDTVDFSFVTKKEKVENNTFAKQETFLQFSERRNRVFVRRNLKDNTYLRNGVILKENSTVFDVGANIECSQLFVQYVSPSKISCLYSNLFP